MLTSLQSFKQSVMSPALFGIVSNHCYWDGLAEFKRTATVGQKNDSVLN